ncbi:MAG: hypothetical protein V4480_00025 [Patescibacteria group bacterium]
MKRILVGLLVVVIGFGLLGAILYKVFYPSSPTPTKVTDPFGNISSNSTWKERSPTTFTTDFYTWYLTSISADSTSAGTPGYKTELSQWLTPDFYSQFDSIGEANDADPILLAQSILPSWLMNMKADLVSQSSSEAVVTIHLRQDPPYNPNKSLTVRLVGGPGAWKVDSVIE